MHSRTLTAVALAALVASMAATPAAAQTTVDFYLRAEIITVNMPDPDAGGGQRTVTMWAFAQDSSFGALNGTPTAPGPILTVPTTATTVRIHVDNNLPVPISIVVPGQKATMVPVYHSGGPYNGRVRSFTHETPAGNGSAVTYTFTGFRPGTFLYHSGTHPGIQVQMGLYGGLKKDAAAATAYPGVPYQAEVILFYSEIDPDLHDAVSGGDYGPGLGTTSPIDYAPKYFLINGRPYPDAGTPKPAGTVGDKVLVRFLNAGQRTHNPMLLGMHMDKHAEDGFQRTHARTLYTLRLTALKTIDVILTPTAAANYPVLDRALNLTNGRGSPGGMLTYLQVAP